MPTSRRMASRFFRSSFRSIPSMTMRPASWASRRLSGRRKVDLPEPEGPMIAVTSPSRKVAETFFRAWKAPKCLSTSVATMIGRAVEVAFMRAALALATDIELALQGGSQRREGGGQNQVDHGNGQENRYRLVAFRLNAIADHGQFNDADRVGQRRVLDQRGQVVGQGRQGDPHALRQRDVDESLGRRQAQGAGSFNLPMRYGEDAGADALGVVGPDIQRQRDDRTGKVGELDRIRQDLRRNQPDKQDLQKQRRTTEQPDVKRTQPT